MDTASFSSIILTICILILVYYGLKFLIRLFAPVLLQQVVKKAEQNFYEQQQQYTQQQQPHQAKTNEMPREKKKVGEYIDYEEIE